MSDESIHSSLDENIDEADFFGDFEDMGSEPKGRKPATVGKKVTDNLLSSSKGFTEGAAEEINESLPRVNALFSETQAFTSDVRTLGSEIQRELRPTITAVRRALHKSMPMAERMMPKKLYDKLNKTLEGYADDATSRAKTQAEQQQASIKAGLAEVFQAQEASRQGERQAEIAEDLVNKVIDARQHKEQLSALNAIDTKLFYQNSFIRTTKTAWMKKMLELKYIQVYTAKEHLSVAKISASLLEGGLNRIAHNTGLPDMQKTRKVEIVGANVRGKALTKVSDTITNYLGGVKDRMTTFAKDKVLGNMNLIKGQAQQMGDFAGMGQDMGVDMGDASKGAAGGMIGKLLGKFGGRRLADTYAPLLGRAEDLAGNLQQTMGFKAQGIKQKLEGQGNILSSLLATFLPEHVETRTIANTLLDDPTARTEFDVATRQAIVEVIPGYLAAMNKSLNDLVTGQDTEMQVFDPVSRGLVGELAAKEAAVSRAFGGENVRSQASLTAVGAFRGALVDKGGQSGKDAFEVVKRDIFKFVTNSANTNAFISPHLIKSYAEGDEADPMTVGGYISKTFKGLNNPQGTASVLVSSMFTGDEIDKVAILQIQNAIADAIQSENWKDIIPQFLDAHGAWGMFRDMGALDSNNNIRDEFLDDVLLNVADTRFDKEVGHSSETMERTLDTRREQEKRLHEQVTVRLPKFMKQMADAVVAKDKAGFAGGFADFFTSGDVAEGGQGIDVNLKSLVDRGRGVATDLGGKYRQVKGRVVGAVDHAFQGSGDREEVKPLAEKIQDGMKPLVEKMEHVFEQAAGTPDSPLHVTMERSSSDDTNTTLTDFHTDFKHYANHVGVQNAMILDAILNGAGSKSGGKLMGLVKGAGRGGLGVLKAYGSIVGGIYKGAGSAIGGALKFGAAGVPALGQLAGVGIKGAVGIATAPWKALGSIGKGLLGLGRRGKPQFVDVYRKDEFVLGKPLIGIKTQKKHARLPSGARLESSADITEPLIHVKTGETLVSQEDIDAGLVDQFGKPLKRIVEGGVKREGKGVLGKLLGGLGKGVGGALRMGTDLLTGGLGAYAKIFGSILGVGAKGVGGLFKWITGGREKKKFHTDVIDRLDKIYNILEKRLPKPKKRIRGDKDGDGDRDGSYEDLMQQKRQKKRTNRMAKLMALFGRGKGKKGKGKPGEEEEEDGLLDNPLIQGGLGAAAWSALKFGGKKVIWPAAKWAGQKAIWPAMKWGGQQISRSMPFARSFMSRAALPMYAAYAIGKGGQKVIDDEAGDARLKEFEENRKMYGYSGAGETLTNTFGLDKSADEYARAQGAWETTKVIGKTTGRVLWAPVKGAQNVGSAANIGVQAVAEMKGPQKVQVLRKALLGNGAIRDPVGWGKWKVVDWNKIGDLGYHDLLSLARDNYFSEDDQKSFAFFAKAKWREHKEKIARVKARRKAEQDAEAKRIEDARIARDKKLAEEEAIRVAKQKALDLKAKALIHDAYARGVIKDPSQAVVDGKGGLRSGVPTGDVIDSSVMVANTRTVDERLTEQQAQLAKQQIISMGINKDLQAQLLVAMQTVAEHTKSLPDTNNLLDKNLKEASKPSKVEQNNNTVVNQGGGGRKSSVKHAVNLTKSN